MTKREYIIGQSLIGTIAALIGGIAFGIWQDSGAAGVFMYIALEVFADVSVALRILSKCDHVTGELQ